MKVRPSMTKLYHVLWLFITFWKHVSCFSMLMPIMPAQAPQRLTACRARRARGTRKFQVLQISHIALSIWFHLIPFDSIWCHLIPCVNLCGWNLSVLAGKRLQKARGNFAYFFRILAVPERVCWRQFTQSQLLRRLLVRWTSIPLRQLHQARSCVHVLQTMR